MNFALQRILYRYGWDTRSRNVLPARLLRPMLEQARRQGRRPLLDVGCGQLGLASFLSRIPVVGVELEAPSATSANVKILLGSVMALPFRESSFHVVSCIDVLEHLAVADRKLAVQELVRVASKAVLIACPHGPVAQACDDEFRRAAASRGRSVPDWVEEHLRQPYPEETSLLAHVHAAAAATGRSATVSSAYCEPVAVTRLIRSAAVRSDLLYVLVNLLFGSILPLFRRPKSSGGYRMVLLADLGRREADSG